MKRAVLTFTAIALLLAGTIAPAQDKKGYKVIVNANNTVTTLNRSEVARMFLKKTTTWNDDTPVLPVDLSASSSVREKFSREIHGKSTATIKNYWQQQIYSGKGTPPPEMPSDEKVISYVESRRGAIGYVDDDKDMGSAAVKVIQVRF